MTAISETNKVVISGVLDTGKDVMANMENIANSSYCWVTYDITTGKWSVVINQPGSSVHSFSDDNIVGAIDLATTQLDRLYNAVEIQFPDADINDSNRFIRAEMAAEDLKQNEPENVLRLTYPLINEQMRALNLGLTELKQSRLDKVIAFNAEYSSFGISAGDIIDITTSTYNFDAKLFRVLQVEEVDTSDGGIELRITANEYSDSVYEHDLSRYTLSNNDGIFSLGDIGPMDAPTITLTEVDQLPNILVESVFATYGAPVTGVEVWAYEVTEADEILNWNNPLVYPDDARNYTQLTTKYSVEETYELGANWSHVIYDLGPGNWLIKIRPINALTKGPFTVPGALTVYDPNVGAGVADDVFDEINSSIGTLSFIAYNDSNTFGSLPSDTVEPNWVAGEYPNTRVLSDAYFTCTKSGVYTVTFLADQNSSAAVGGRGAFNNGSSLIYPSEHADWVHVAIDLKDSLGNTVGFEGSGGPGAAYWTDYFTTFPVTLTAGEQYFIQTYYQAYTGQAPGNNLSFTMNVNVQYVNAS